MLFSQMNTNIEVRNGRNGSPSGPMTSITMLLRMKLDQGLHRVLEPAGNELRACGTR